MSQCVRSGKYLQTKPSSDSGKSAVHAATDVHKRTMEIDTKLRKRFSNLLEMGADPLYVAYILSYAESERKQTKDFMEKRKELKLQRVWDDWKKVQEIIREYPEDFQKKLLFKFGGEAYRLGLEMKRTKKRYLERVGKNPTWKQIDKVKLPKKPTEWYLDKVILDLGAYFEFISPQDVKQVEQRRHYQLIADLLYDFDLFKQPVRLQENESRIVKERVVKRAESIPAKKWKDHIQGVRESFRNPLLLPVKN